MASLSNFRSNFVGVRQNRFKVTGNFPVMNGIAPADFEFYCKAASIPGSAIGVIPVGYKGRPVKYSGERTYADWLVQIYDSPVKDFRGSIENWIEKMNGRDTLNITPNSNGGSNYYLTIEYMEQGADGSDNNVNNNYQRKIKLWGAFPTELSPMEVSYDTPDTFAEFTVTFTYDFWTYI